jgi:hypothetical protein
MTQPMTLLQRGVIDRLRAAGQSVIAEEAREHWRLGERVDADAAFDIRSEELRRDFERANKQIAPDR